MKLIEFTVLENFYMVKMETLKA